MRNAAIRGLVVPGVLVMISGCSLVLFADDPAPTDSAVDSDAGNEAGNDAGDALEDGATPEGDGDGEVGPRCGDGEVDPGEECDEGSLNSDVVPDACRSTCVRAHCGDGVRDTGEACDDGNTVDTDACGNGCSLATCGNGVIDTGEECDDGNGSNTDSCLNTCMDARCGDGFVRRGSEQCDDALAPRACTTSCGTTGEQRCVACAWGGCDAPVETCDGVDQDCNSVCDDGFPCCAGSTEVEACGPCATRSRPCSETCDPGLWGPCSGGGVCEVGATELQPCGYCGMQERLCNESCTWDDWGACMGSGECAAGTGRSCVMGCGSTGSQTCSASCMWSECTAAEACNGTDDDCDLVCDDGFVCCLGTVTTCAVGTCIGAVTCGAGCVWGSCTLPETADSCADPVQVIPPTGGTFTGATCGAANDSSGACGGAGAADVLYRLRLAARTRVTLSTAGSSLDTVVYVRSGSGCPGTAEVACDDNGGGGGGASLVVAVLDAGEYWIVVDGAAAGVVGDFVLTAAVAVPPANDGCANAVNISAGGTLAGTTIGASNDNPGCAGSNGNDVWYRFTLAAPMYVDLDAVGATFDSVLDLRNGCGGTTVGCNDDACGGDGSHLIRRMEPGTYYLAVDGYSSASEGSFTLAVQFVSTAGCGTTSTGSLANGLNAGSNSGMLDDMIGSCSASVGGSDVVFAFGGCAGRAVEMTTCSPGSSEFDSLLYVRRGSCTGSQVGCNDNGSGCAGGASYLSFTPSTAGPYFLVVDGAYATAIGTFQVHVSGL